MINCRINMIFPLLSELKLASLKIWKYDCWIFGGSDCPMQSHNQNFNPNYNTRERMLFNPRTQNRFGELPNGTEIPQIMLYNF